jgi:hypothetical protein
MTLRVLWEDFQLTSDASLQKVYTLPILARSITVNINDYTQADTFSCEIDYKSFPFDPRLIRACAVTIHFEDKGQVFKGDNQLNLITPTKENTIFQGFVDEESIEFREESRTVKFEGRDFTAILLDTKYLEGVPVDVGTPLDELIRSLLAAIPAASDIKVVNRTDTTLPTIKQFYPQFGEKLGGQKNTEKDDSYWDLIQRLITNAGLICYIELDSLVISAPSVLYKKDKAVRFIYGRNIKNLNFKRKIGRQKGFNVAVRCLNLESKEVLIAQIPKECTADFTERTQIQPLEVQIPQVNPDGSKGEPKPAPYVTFRVTNIRDKNQLIKVGENIFEEMSRQQLEGSFETHEMCTRDLDKKEFDILKLRCSTPLSIEIDQGDMKNLDALFNRYDAKVPKQIEARTSEIAKFLKARCYAPEVAEVIAKTYRKFEPIFYTKSVTYNLDSDNGFRVSVEFINFIDLERKAFGLEQD